MSRNGSRPSSMAGGSRSSSASSRRVVVSLEFLPGNTSVQTPITNEFSSHLPLTDLQWKSSSRSTTRTIETLSLDFRPFKDAVKEAAPQQIPINLLERPYLHLLFVVSDDNEAYRTTLRPQIRDWLNTVQSKRLQEWLIVHVTAQKTGTAKFYQRKGSVFDKIRADFNTGKKDRIVQLPVPGSQADESNADYMTIWREFLAKVKDSIVTSFDNNFTSYEEDVRKIDSQRQLPGWNFCTFFIQKEGLAQSFEGMNLLEDALIQYDELEASYYLGAKDQTLPWFTRIGGAFDGDDSLSILAAEAKPYRSLIMQNNISVFDFRVYLFSRQASLVSGLGRIVDLAKRAKTFIYNMTRLLRSHGNGLHRYFLESWIYSACLEVVAKCHTLLDARKMNAAAVPDLLPMLAELAELATRQVEKLGMAFGYLPRKHPFLMSVDSLPLEEYEDKTENDDGPLDTPRHFKSSNKSLEASFSSREAFDDAYRRLLNQVHDAWSGSLRIRHARKVKGTLAAFEQAREHTKVSLDIYQSLAQALSASRWTSIEAQILRQTSDMRSDSTDKAVQKERLLAVLALIRTGMEMGSLKWSMGEHQADSKEVAERLMKDVRILSEQLEKDFAAVAFPTFSIALAQAYGQGLPDDDGVSVTATITNLLPCTVEVDEIRLKFLSTNEEPLWLTCGRTLLPPGKTGVKVEALISVVGTYALDVSQIRTSRIVFQYPHRPHIQSAFSPSSSHQPPFSESLLNSSQPLVHFSHDPSSLDVSIREALEAHLDKPRQMLLSLYQGRGVLTKAIIRLSPPQGRLRIFAASATATTKNCRLVINEQDLSFELTEFNERLETSTICIDYEAFSQMQFTQIPVAVDYYTASRPGKRHVMKTCIQLRTALPMAVNVQDYIRDTFLLSRFSVSTDQRLPLRIRGAELEETPNFSFIAAAKSNARSLIVHRNQPGAFLFRISRNVFDDESENASRMRITFTYRTIQTELESILEPHIAQVFSKHTVPLSRRMLKAIILLFSREQTCLEELHSLHILDSIGQQNLHLMGNISGTSAPLVDLDLLKYKEHLRTFWTTEDEWERIADALKLAWSTPVQTSNLVNLPWRTVSIPFDIPSIAIYARVSFKLPPMGPYTIRIGQHISCTMTIHTTFNWAHATERFPLIKLCRGEEHLDIQQVPTGKHSDCGIDVESSSQEEEDNYGKGQRMVFEIHPDPSDWLVVGSIRREFFIYNTDANGIYTYNEPLILVPQREGDLRLPNVSVRPLPDLPVRKLNENEETSYENDSDEDDRLYFEGAPGSLPTCETFLEDAARVVSVVDLEPPEANFVLNMDTGEVTSL